MAGSATGGWRMRCNAVQPTPTLRRCCSLQVAGWRAFSSRPSSSGLRPPLAPNLPARASKQVAALRVAAVHIDVVWNLASQAGAGAAAQRDAQSLSYASLRRFRRTSGHRTGGCALRRAANFFFDWEKPVQVGRRRCCCRMAPGPASLGAPQPGRALSQWCLSLCVALVTISG